MCIKDLWAICTNCKAENLKELSSLSNISLQTFPFTSFLLDTWKCFALLCFPVGWGDFSCISGRTNAYINLELPLLATEQCAVASATAPSRDKKEKEVLEQLISMIMTFLNIQKWAALQMMKTEWYGKVLFK